MGFERGLGYISTVNFGPEAGKRGRRDATTFSGTSASTELEEC